MSQSSEKTRINSQGIDELFSLGVFIGADVPL